MDALPTQIDVDDLIENIGDQLIWSDVGDALLSDDVPVDDADAYDWDMDAGWNSAGWDNGNPLDDDGFADDGGHLPF